MNPDEETGPPAPVWHAEPNEADWVHPPTGLLCHMERHEELGSWAGYVRLSDGHLFTGKRLSLPVHGGVTFAGPLGERGGWWLGFDCGHARDLKPYLASSVESLLTQIGEHVANMGPLIETARKLFGRDPYQTYKTYEFAYAQTERLASAIANYAYHSHTDFSQPPQN